MTLPTTVLKDKFTHKCDFCTYLLTPHADGKSSEVS